MSTSSIYTVPTSQTKLFVASVVWAAGIIPLTWLSSSFLSIPGAFGAGFFWLPQILMVTGAIFLGPWGWVAAAIGTFLGGMFAGSPLAINFAQNPVPAFLANTLLLYVLWRLFKIKVRTGKLLAEINTGMIRAGIGLTVITVGLALAVGYIVGPSFGRWGYLVVFLVTLPAWWTLRQMGLAFPVDRNVALALLAVVISSVASAAMGAFAWSTIGQMGASAWVIVFPGWGLGDIVAGTLAVPLIFAFHQAMKQRGLVWRALG